MLGEYDQVLGALVQQLKPTSQQISQMDCTLQAIHSKFGWTPCLSFTKWFPIWLVFLWDQLLD